MQVNREVETEGALLSLGLTAARGAPIASTCS
jgi:hypothetical protein